MKVKNRGEGRYHLHGAKIVLNDGLDKPFTGDERYYPCYKCQDRKIGCHQDCQKYAEYKRLLKEQKGQ